MALSKSPDDSLQLATSFEVKVGGKPLPKDILVMKILVKSEVNKIAKAYLSIAGGKSYENLFPESEIFQLCPWKDRRYFARLCAKKRKGFFWNNYQT